MLNRVRSTLFTLTLLLTAAAAYGAGGEGIDLSAPEFHKIVPEGAKIEKLAGGFKFTEGPLWTREGFLIFSDIPNDVVRKWDPKTRALSDFRAPAQATNGNTLDRQGRVVSCEHSGRRVSRREPDGGYSTIVDKYEGKRLNSPNDVVFKSDGAMYFTDPPYGLPMQDRDPGKELKFNGVYRYKEGKLTLLTSELTRPNGLAFSPDERTLYVANSDAARKLWMAYPVKTDGTLGPGKVFFDVTKNQQDGLPDGMKVDREGNVYGTGPGGIWVIDPSGKFLGMIRPEEAPANCAWGDDGKTLYMTARTGLYRIRLNVAGVRPY